MTLDQARAKVNARMGVVMGPAEERVTVDASAVPVLFAGTDLYGPGVTRWLQELGGAVCFAVGVPAEDGAPIAGELLRAFLVGHEMGRAS